MWRTPKPLEARGGGRRHPPTAKAHDIRPRQERAETVAPVGAASRSGRRQTHGGGIPVSVFCVVGQGDVTNAPLFIVVAIVGHSRSTCPACPT